MKKKDPAFLFYSKDWLEGTAEYSPEEKGVYIDLLCYQHQRGNLPTDLERLSRLVRLNKKDFIKIWDIISEKFVKKDEKYINSKLQEVMQERSDKGHKNKIIGTFGYVLKKLTISPKTEKKLREMFNVNDFLNDSEWDSERCTEWCKNAIAVIEDEDVNKDISKEYDNIEDKFEKFVLWFNKEFNRDFRPLSKLLPKFENILKVFTVDELVNACKNAYKDDFHKENNHKYLTVAFFLREDKVDMYKTKFKSIKPKFAG